MTRWLGNLAVMAFGLVAGLLLLEAGVRLAGFRPPSARADRLLGQRYRAGARYLHTGEEGKSSGRFNAAGWRDAEHSETKPAGTTRILFLGDSYVSAFQVPLDSTFHRRLERALNARALPGRRFEVIALGQDGAGTASEYLMWHEWGRRYDPDLVAVLFMENDPADNWRPYALDLQRPFFVEEGDSLRLDLSFRDTPGFRKWERPNWLREHSAMWAALGGAVERLRVRRVPRVVGGDVQDGYYGAWNFDRRVLPDTLTPFRITEKIYTRFAREVQDSAPDGDPAGARPRPFVAFHVAFGQQEDTASLDSLRQDPNFDENKSPRWFLGVGERHGFPVVPLSPALRAASRANGGRPLWFGHKGVYGHWNSAGHAVVADAMARYFARTLPGLDTTGTTPADVPGVRELEASSSR